MARFTLPRDLYHGKGSLEELLAAAGGCPGVIKCEIIGG